MVGKNSLHFPLCGFRDSLGGPGRWGRAQVEAPDPRGRALSIAQKKQQEEDFTVGDLSGNLLPFK